MNHPNPNLEPVLPAQSEFLRVLSERGFFHQCTGWEALDNRLCQGPVTAYIGFDATADSLHVGHLLSIMTLRWLQRTGHKPLVLMGGGTTRIGDPSFRDSTRPFLDDEQIADNIAGIHRVFAQFLRFGDGPTDAVMVNNADWLDGLGYIAFLRDFGRHFSVNRMLTFDSVRQRLERQQSLTFLEFNYMLLQAYDFVELARKFDCTLQMGGSDQWGNIVNGVELGRRVQETELFGLTTPLLTTASGAKMGKTAGGAVWLNAERLSPYEFWQFWRNTEDADVGRFLRLFTELPLEQIAQLEALPGSGINSAKKILANEVTSLVHGEEAARQAAETAKKTFEEGQQGEGLPTFHLTSSALQSGVALEDLFVSAQLAKSKGEARRLIAGGGARLNDEVVPTDRKVTVSDVNASGGIKLSAGKKRHALLQLVEGESTS